MSGSYKYVKWWKGTETRRYDWPHEKSFREKTRNKGNMRGFFKFYVKHSCKRPETRREIWVPDTARFARGVHALAVNRRSHRPVIFRPCTMTALQDAFKLITGLVYFWLPYGTPLLLNLKLLYPWLTSFVMGLPSHGYSIELCNIVPKELLCQWDWQAQAHGISVLMDLLNFHGTPILTSLLRQWDGFAYRTRTLVPHRTAVIMALHYHSIRPIA